MYRWQGNICHCEKRWLQNLLQKQFTILCRGSWNLRWSRRGRHQNIPVHFALTSGFNSVCFFNTDTDILILGCYFSNRIEGNLLIKLLTKPTRIFDFTQHLLDANYCNALPGYQAVTGCDYTSSFHDLGKTKGLKLLKDNLSFEVRVDYLYVK